MAKTRCSTTSEQDTQPSVGRFARWLPGAKARAERAHYKALFEAISEPSLRHMRFENGELNMELSGAVIRHFALLFAEHARKLGAHNYISMGLHTALGECFEITFQKVGGKTPTQVAQERQELCNELAAALAAAEEELRLIRMKDHGTIYNPALSTQITLALQKAVPQTGFRTPSDTSNTDPYPNTTVATGESDGSV